MSKVHRLVGIAGCMALAVALIAQPAPAQAGAAKGKPIKVMVLGSFSGRGLDFHDIPAAAEAAAAAINKGGGVGVEGRPIEVLTCDAVIDPNAIGDCAREAVEEEVVAVVGAFTVDGDQYIPVLEKARIASVAPFGISFPELTSDISFPIAGGVLAAIAGMGALLADEEGVETMDVSYQDVPGEAGAFAATLVEFVTEPRGLPAPTSTPQPIGGADLAPSAQATIDKDTEGVVLATTDPEFSRWLQAYRQAGGEAKLAATSSAVNPDNVKALGDLVDNVFVSNNYKPALLKRDPGIKRLHREVNAYDEEIRLVDASIGAWAGVHLVADALAGTDTQDAATLLAALNEDRDYKTDVTPPVNFTKPNSEVAGNPLLASSISRLFNIDVYYTQIINGSFKAIDRGSHNPLLP